MKKPNVLNRAMFNRGGTSAYGRGITSNLVSDEQRQRYNYGGRVGYQNRGYVNIRNLPEASGGVYKIPGMPYDRIPVGYDYIGGDPVRDYKMVGDWYIDEQGNRVYDEEKTDFIPWKEKLGTDDVRTRTQFDETQIEQYNAAQRAKKRKQAELGIDPTPDSGRVFDDTAGDWRKNIAIPGVVREEKEEVISRDPDDILAEETRRQQGQLPGTPEGVGKEEPTDILDVDRWAFLDENIAKKKKLARGHALMEGAAAAADWAFADTKAKQGAAISKGLRGAGTIGAKYKGEAEDIKTKAQILGTIEDIKSEGKRDLFEDRRKGYYEPSLELEREGLELKKDAARLLAEGKDGLSTYNDILLTDSKALRDPFTKRDMIRSLTGKNLQVESEKNKKTLNNKENEGLIFLDISGNIVRNKGDGTTEIVDETTDEFFTWKS